MWSPPLEESMLSLSPWMHCIYQATIVTERMSPWMHCIDQATIFTEYMSPWMHCIYQATCTSSRTPLLREDPTLQEALLLVGLLQGAHLQEAHRRQALVGSAASPAWPWPSAIEHSANYNHHSTIEHTSRQTTPQTHSHSDRHRTTNCNLWQVRPCLLQPQHRQSSSSSRAAGSHPCTPLQEQLLQRSFEAGLLSEAQD